MLKRVIHNAGSSVALAASSAVLQLAITPVLISKLGAVQFGEWVLCLSVASYAAFTDFGVHTALTQISAQLIAVGEFATLRRLVAKSTALLMATASVGMLVVIIIAPSLGSVFSIRETGRAGFELAIRVSAVQAAMTMSLGVWKTVLVGAQKIVLANIVSLAGNIVRAVAAVAVAGAGYGLVEISVVVLIATAAELGVGLIIAAPLLSGHNQHDRLEAEMGLRKVMAFGGPLAFGNLAGKILSESDRVVVGFLFGPIAVSVYEIGLRLSNYARTSLYAASALIPKTAELIHLQPKPDASRLFVRASRLLFLVFLVVTLSFFFVGDLAIKNWVGQAFYGSVPIAALLLLGSLVQSTNVAGYYFLIGMGKLGRLTTLMVLYPVVNIPLMFGLGSLWGPAGVASANLASFLLLELPFSKYLFREMSVSWSPDGRSLTVLWAAGFATAAACAGLQVAIISSYGLLPRLVCGAAVALWATLAIRELRSALRMM